MPLLMTKPLLLLAFITVTTQMTQASINPALPQSPWQKNAIIAKSRISPIYTREWAKSDTKKVCPILALPNNASAQQRYSNARSANFSGGWGVAYDIAKTRNTAALRSAYGVANAGTSNESGLFAWKNQAHYSDGSYVTYGHEGDDPNSKRLAYILLNNGCFYNMWSQYGEGHLIKMLNNLHYVK